MPYNNHIQHKRMINFFKKKPLIGLELAAKVKELDHLSKTEIAIACGYVSKMKDGSDRVDFAAFYTAVLDAFAAPTSPLDLNSKGITLGPHRKLSYIATVQSNGNLLIGKAYTAMMDLDPGDQFEIKLDKNEITLTRMGPLEDPWFL